MNHMLYIILGLIAGVLSGLFGIGGGTILIPALILFCGLTQHQAQGTTLMVFILPVGILAALKYFQAGNVKIGISLFVCLGFFFGGFLGAQLAHLAPDPVLKKLFGAFLLLVSVSMIFGK